MKKNEIKRNRGSSLPALILNKTCKKVLLGGFVCLLLSATSHPALSSSAPPTSLKDIASDFLTSIGDGFEDADKAMERAELNALKDPLARVQFSNVGASGDTIPDGEELLMRILVGEHNLALPLDIIAIKQGHDIKMSLTDLFSAADIAVRVSPDTGTASGWFIRENQNFFLDIPNQKVTVVDETFPIDPALVTVENNDIFVTSYVLSEWFNLRFIHDFTELAIHIKTEQPLPIEERFMRRKKKKPRTGGLSDPVLAETGQPYQLFSVPQSELTTRYSYSKLGDADAQTKTSWSAISSGDIAYHGLESFVSGNNDNRLNNARLTFKKESQNPDLLGKLKAQQYSFGDIHTARIPITGGSSQELGFYVSNKSTSSSTTSDTTDFRGDGTPGWEVELYRDDTFIDFQEIENDGKYDFTNVKLFLGDNDFKLIFYGPQGEIQVQEKNILVSQNALTSAKLQYEFSASSNNSETYEVNNVEKVNDDKLHLIGKVAKKLSPNLTVETGFRSRQEEEDQRTYLTGGLSTRLNDTLINATAAHEVQDGGSALELVARRKLGSHSLRSKLQVNNSSYNPGNSAGSDVTTSKGDISISGPLKHFIGINPSYILSSDFRSRDSGAYDYKFSGAANTRMGNMTLNKSLSYEFLEDALGETSDSVQGALNSQGFFGRARWRVVGGYDIKPTTELRNMMGSINYPFTPKVKGRFEMSHDFNPSKTETTASVDWQHEKVSISPRLTIDTEDKVQASVNTRVGIGYEPNKSNFNLYNKRIASSGSLSARIFLDLNGDGQFNEGDELLPDVELDAVQSRRSAKSDEHGIAHIPDMPRGRLTDVRLDRESFADPFWSSVYEGFSVRPRAGVNTTANFPVVVSGEIDGTVKLKDAGGNTRAASNYTLYLFTPEGRLAQGTKTSYDGFYIFTNILPGTYYMTVSNADAQITGYLPALPKKVIIEPNGTILLGQNITLQRGPAIKYSFSSNEMVKSHPHSTITPEGAVTPSIVIGEYKSRLAMTLGWFNLKRKFKSIARELELETSLSDIQRDPKTSRFHIKTKLQQPNLQKAVDLCKLLSAQDYDCTINLHTDFPQQVAGSDTKKPS